MANILVVEDNLNLAFGLTLNLEHAGHRPSTVASQPPDSADGGGGGGGDGSGGECDDPSSWSADRLMRSFLWRKTWSPRPCVSLSINSGSSSNDEANSPESHRLPARAGCRTRADDIARQLRSISADRHVVVSIDADRLPDGYSPYYDGLEFRVLKREAVERLLDAGVRRVPTFLLIDADESVTLVREGLPRS